MGLLPIAALAEISLPDIISDNMVLQQQSDALLWGWATPGSEITVTPEWDNIAYTTKADKDSGRWEVRVHTPAASYAPTL